MKTKILMTVLAALLIPASVFADESKLASKQSLEQNQPVVTADGAVTGHDNMTQAIAFINAIENRPQNAGDAVNVVYNDDGTIKNVTLVDGTIVNYSYERDESGSINKITLSTNTTSVIFTNRRGEQVEPTEEVTTVEVFTKEKTETGAEQQNKVIELYYTRNSIDLEELSKTPVKFDFTEINRAIKEASDMKASALKEYEQGISPYYKELESNIEARNYELTALDPELAVILSGIDKEGASQNSKRAALDEAVDRIINMPGEKSAAVAVRDIVAVEKELREKVVRPARDIYEGKVDAALEYINSMIDRLLESRIAICLNVNLKKDRIDAVINLPETPPAK